MVVLVTGHSLQNFTNKWLYISANFYFLDGNASQMYKPEARQGKQSDML